MLSVSPPLRQKTAEYCGRTQLWLDQLQERLPQKAQAGLETARLVYVRLMPRNRAELFFLLAISLLVSKVYWNFASSGSLDPSFMEMVSRFPLPDFVTTLDKLLAFVNCKDPVKDPYEIEKLRMFFKEESIIARTSNCDLYFQIISSVAFDPLTEEERAFPVAVSHSVHSQVGLLEMTLAVTFRPRDAHCIHVDLKAPKEVQDAVRGIVKCYKEKFPYSDIMVPKYQIPVFWGYESVLEADMICIRELLKTNTPWRMYMNPAGSELPLKPFREMRRMIMENGENNVIDFEPFNKTDRQLKVFRTYRFGPKPFDIKMQKIKTCRKPPAPHNITVLKAQKNVILKREFVNFLVYHPVAIDYYNWLSDSFIPDEHFFSTMSTVEADLIGKRRWTVRQHIPDPRIPQSKLCFRKSLWNYPNCSGQSIHWICNLGVRDLPLVREGDCLMANKFNLTVDVSAVLCQVKALKKMARGLFS